MCKKARRIFLRVLAGLTSVTLLTVLAKPSVCAESPSPSQGFSVENIAPSGDTDKYFNYLDQHVGQPTASADAYPDGLPELAGAAALTTHVETVVLMSRVEKQV